MALDQLDFHKPKIKFKNWRILDLKSCKNLLKWIIDLNAKPKTIKLIGENHYDYDLVKLFSNIMHRTQTIQDW
jgi:hypothetical protein